MTATDYLEAKLLDHVMGNGAYTPPTSLYLCLHITDPTETGTVGQVVGGSYLPQLITFGPQSISKSSSSNAQTFTNMPQVTISHFVIRENSPTGNPLFVGLLTPGKTLNAGDPISFGVGQIAILAD
jgi:hypothetical protein